MTQRTVIAPARVYTELTLGDVTTEIRAILVSGGPVEFLGSTSAAAPADREGAVPIRNHGDGFDGSQTLEKLFGDATILRLFVLPEAEAIISVAY